MQKIRYIKFYDSYHSLGSGYAIEDENGELDVFYGVKNGLVSSQILSNIALLKEQGYTVHMFGTTI